jgi:phosphatidylinositol alpha 1,6-mannosyltransferase
VFPSRTDTFGNVVLEALSSGVPALVTNEGGPRHIVQHGETGFVAQSDREFVAYLRYAIENRSRLVQMSTAARAYAMRQNWDAVFRDVFAAYEKCVGESICRISERLIPRNSKALRRRAI